MGEWENMEYRIGNIYNKKIEKCTETREVLLTSYVENIDVEKITSNFNRSVAFDFDAEISRLENDDYSLYEEDEEIVRAECMARVERYKQDKKDRYIRNKKKSINRAMGKLFRYTELNAFQYKDANGYVIKPSMVTLTFHENTQDFEYTNKEFTNYIKRLNYYIYGYKCSNLRYIGVPELQTKNFNTTGRCAIHFHILFFNLPFIDIRNEETRNEWNSLWREGKCPDISCKGVPDNAVGIAKYITKYMSKQFYSDILGSDDKQFFYDPSLWEGKKVYFASRNLIKPDIYKVTETELNDILFLFDDIETETKDIVCSYEDFNGMLVEKFIGTVTKVKLPTERMDILNKYLENLKDFQVISYDEDWEDKEECEEDTFLLSDYDVLAVI